MPPLYRPPRRYHRTHRSRSHRPPTIPTPPLTRFDITWKVNDNESLVNSSTMSKSQVNSLLYGWCRRLNSKTIYPDLIGLLSNYVAYDIASILQTMDGKEEIISDPFPIGNACLCNLSINSKYEIRINLIKRYNRSLNIGTIEAALNSGSFHLKENPIAMHKYNNRWYRNYNDYGSQMDSMVLYAPPNMTYTASRDLWRDKQENDPFKLFMIEQEYKYKDKRFLGIFDIFKSNKNKIKERARGPIKVEYKACDPINYERTKYAHCDTITLNLSLCFKGNIKGIVNNAGNFTISTADIKFN